MKLGGWDPHDGIIYEEEERDSEIAPYIKSPDVKPDDFDFQNGHSRRRKPTPPSRL